MSYHPYPKLVQRSTIGMMNQPALNLVRGLGLFHHVRSHLSVGSLSSLGQVAGGASHRNSNTKFTRSLENPQIEASFYYTPPFTLYHPRKFRVRTANGRGRETKRVLLTICASNFQCTVVVVGWLQQRWSYFFPFSLGLCRRRSRSLQGRMQLRGEREREQIKEAAV